MKLFSHEYLDTHFHTGGMSNSLLDGTTAIA